jgi:uncharacterized protein YutE (UPF0331/DUF86 family)
MAPLGADPRVLREHLRHLQRCLADLTDLGQRDMAEIARARHLPRALERDVQIVIESCFDISAHLLARLGGGSPATYAGYADALFEAGLIDESSLGKVRAFASLRDRLVHVYLSVSLRELHGFARSELGFFREFARTVEALIDDQQRRGSQGRTSGPA